MEKILLKTSSSEENIYIGKGAAESRLPRLTEGQKNFVVTDSNVYVLYSEFFARFFPDTEIFVLSAGEENKSFENLGAILSRMTEAGLHRSSRLFAVGGGVVGDIGGLAAALYMRGISCVQVPTTLLSQVDSGVGGKTAVDLNGVKNVVGAFYQPFEALIDPVFLKTLPDREIKCGLGEIVKYAALDGKFFDVLQQNTRKFGDPDFLSSLISPSIRLKAKVVTADEKEAGERKSLNVGHTTGHAIELSSSLSHGESVLWGMLFETKLAVKYGIAEKAYAERLLNIVLAALSTNPRSEADFSDIGNRAEKARADKKNASGDEICMSVAKSKGEWTLFSLPFAKYKAGLEEIADGLKIEKCRGQV